MFYVPRVTVSVIVGSKYSCAMFQGRTMNMRPRRRAFMSTRPPQPQCRVSPDRALVLMRLLKSRCLIVIADKGEEGQT